VKVGDLIRPMLDPEGFNPRAIVLEIKEIPGRLALYAEVKFFHLPLPSTVYMPNYEVISESR
tara:strand:+ start:596 stop:781 length:186 start_codon:yes stop_codon:yes gene_type:complete